MEIYGSDTTIVEREKIELGGARKKQSKRESVSLVRSYHSTWDSTSALTAPAGDRWHVCVQPVRLATLLLEYSTERREGGTYFFNVIYPSEERSVEMFAYDLSRLEGGARAEREGRGRSRFSTRLLLSICRSSI
ncbi:hypothetical protein EVAR_93340_1 [Eumeta japonica]|uniref:Uncharacterized protein n=1 Tax=Eumeta variegata TaxID=151549 RepID=A0A4C1USU0_EUMVA|nr:hypothetical protein EVAR_93340_1 [Eumeta japonica]